MHGSLSMRTSCPNSQILWYEQIFLRPPVYYNNIHDSDAFSPETTIFDMLMHKIFFVLSLFYTTRCAVASPVAQSQLSGLFPVGSGGLTSSGTSISAGEKGSGHTVNVGVDDLSETLLGEHGLLSGTIFSGILAVSNYRIAKF